MLIHIGSKHTSGDDSDRSGKAATWVGKVVAARAVRGRRRTLVVRGRCSGTGGQRRGIEEDGGGDVSGKVTASVGSGEFGSIMRERE
jgi:hypothetical protein